MTFVTVSISVIDSFYFLCLIELLVLIYEYLSNQEKRGDQEVEQLFRALELTTEIKQAQVANSYFALCI